MHISLSVYSYLVALLQMSAAAATSEVVGGRRKVFRNEGIGMHRLQDMRVTTDFTFGIELELFFPASVDANDVRSALRAAGITEWR